jgi:hypothetical protein
MERLARGARRLVVDGSRIVAEDVAVETVADVLDGLASRQLPGPGLPLTMC